MYIYIHWIFSYQDQTHYILWHFKHKGTQTFWLGFSKKIMVRLPIATSSKQSALDVCPARNSISGGLGESPKPQDPFPFLFFPSLICIHPSHTLICTGSVGLWHGFGLRLRLGHHNSDQFFCLPSHLLLHLFFLPLPSCLFQSEHCNWRAMKKHISLFCGPILGQFWFRSEDNFQKLSLKKETLKITKRTGIGKMGSKREKGRLE